MILPLDYPDADIQMYCDTDTEARLRITACKKEPETLEFIRSIPKGSVFMDIGANTGAYTLIAAHLGLKVYAFEPAPANHKRLLENLALNRLKAEVHTVILWKESGSVGFKLSSEEIGAALHEVTPEGDWSCWSLDDWVEWTHSPPPEYIKLDVDGCELEVLQGAVQALNTVKGLQVETDDSKAPQALIGFLQDLGFKERMWTRHGEGPISNVWWER